MEKNHKQNVSTMDFTSALGMLEDGTVDTAVFLHRQTPDRVLRFASTVPMPVPFLVPVSLHLV